MNRKLALIPTVLISSALLLTACSGNGQHSTPSQTASSPAASTPANGGAASNSGATATATPKYIQGYVAPPKDMTQQYKVFFHAPETDDPQIWQVAQAAGAKTYQEDPSPRSLTMSDYATLRADKSQLMTGLTKVNREIESDYETTALNVSAFLTKNPNATLDDIKANKSLIVNRYPNVGSTDIVQDSSTKFFFAVFTLSDANFRGVRSMGILVPQAGKTPDFHTRAEDAASAQASTQQ